MSTDPREANVNALAHLEVRATALPGTVEHDDPEVVHRLGDPRLHVPGDDPHETDPTRRSHFFSFTNR